LAASRTPCPGALRAGRASRAHATIATARPARAAGAARSDARSSDAASPTEPCRSGAARAVGTGLGSPRDAGRAWPCLPRGAMRGTAEHPAERRRQRPPR